MTTALYRSTENDVTTTTQIYDAPVWRKGKNQKGKETPQAFTSVAGGLIQSQGTAMEELDIVLCQQTQIPTILRGTPIAQVVLAPVVPAPSPIHVSLSVNSPIVTPSQSHPEFALAFGT